MPLALGLALSLAHARSLNEGGGVTLPAWLAPAVARMTTPPTAPELTRIATLGQAIPNTKLDFFHRLSAETEQAASVNWVADAFNLTKVDAPVFTAGQGYQGDGVNDALTTGLVPSSAGGKQSLNDATMGALILGPDGSGVKVEMGAAGGTGNDFIGCNGLSPLLAVNASTSLTTIAAAPPAVGLWTAVRRSSGLVDEYCGRYKVNSRSVASTALPSGALRYLASSTANFSSRKVAMGFYGQALSDAEVTAMADAIHADMKATGGYAKRAAVVCDGNSLTVGYNGQVPWTTVMQTAYDGGSVPIAVRNTAVTGQKTDQMLGLLTGPKMLSACQYPADHRILVAWEIRNHMAVGGATAVQAVDKLQEYCVAQRALGYEKIIVCNTIADGSGDTDFTPTLQATVNAELSARYATFADYLVDLAADARLQDPNNATYYNTDKLHLVSAGYAVVADIIKPKVDLALAALGL